MGVLSRQHRRDYNSNANVEARTHGDAAVATATAATVAAAAAIVIDVDAEAASCDDAAVDDMPRQHRHNKNNNDDDDTSAPLSGACELRVVNTCVTNDTIVLPQRAAVALWSPFYTYAHAAQHCNDDDDDDDATAKTTARPRGHASNATATRRWWLHDVAHIVLGRDATLPRSCRLQHDCISRLHARVVYVSTPSLHHYCLRTYTMRTHNTDNDNNKHSSSRRRFTQPYYLVVNYSHNAVYVNACALARHECWQLRDGDVLSFLECAYDTAGGVLYASCAATTTSAPRDDDDDDEHDHVAAAASSWRALTQPTQLCVGGRVIAWQRPLTMSRRVRRYVCGDDDDDDNDDDDNDDDYDDDDDAHSPLRGRLRVDFAALRRAQTTTTTTTIDTMTTTLPPFAYVQPAVLPVYVFARCRGDSPSRFTSATRHLQLPLSSSSSSSAAAASRYVYYYYDDVNDGDDDDTRRRSTTTTTKRDRATGARARRSGAVAETASARPGRATDAAVVGGGARVTAHSRKRTRLPSTRHTTSVAVLPHDKHSDDKHSDNDDDDDALVWVDESDTRLPPRPRRRRRRRRSR